VAMLIATGVFRSGIEAAWTAGANKFAFITEVSNLTFGGVGLMMLGAAGFLIYNAFANASQLKLHRAFYSIVAACRPSLSHKRQICLASPACRRW